MAFRKGDRVLLKGDHEILARIGEKVGGHLGIVDTSKLVGKREGSAIKTHLGNEFIAIRPSVIEVLSSLKRGPQVILPRDASIILAVSGAKGDSIVYDVGSGSGWLSIFLGHYVRHVYTFEVDKEFYGIAKGNIEKTGMKNMTIRKRDVISQGFGRRGADLVTIDLREPHKVVPHATKALNPGGWVFCHCPVIEQVRNVEKALVKHGFSGIRIIQNVQQEWKANPTRPIRQEIGHTAFLVFGRKL